MATSAGKKTQFRWSVGQDVVLLKSVASLRPTIAHQWDQVASATRNGVGRDLTRRAVQDRFKILIKDFISEDNKKIRRENV